MLKPHKINLVRRLREAPAGRASVPWRAVPVVVILLLAMALQLGLMMARRADLADEMAAIRQVTALQGERDHAAVALAGYEALALQRDVLAAKVETLAGGVDYRAAHAAAIYRAADAAGVDIEGVVFERQTGALTLTCTASAVTAGAALTEALSGLDAVADVRYSGYSAAGAGYAFTLICTLAPAE